MILTNEFGGGKTPSNWILDGKRDQHRMLWYPLGLLVQPVLGQDKPSKPQC